MKASLFHIVAAVALSGTAAGLPASSSPLEDRATGPSVTIADGTVVGSSLGLIESWAGIPFAQAPVGPLRFKPPQKLNSSFGTLSTTGLGPSCPQMYFSTTGDNTLTSVLGTLLNTPFLQTLTDTTEDCLTMKVQRPIGTKAGANLPVLVYIFGGGFELGSAQLYDGTNFLNGGLLMGKPFVYVAINYRVGGFGFMGGKEILADGSANVGLLDQRLALEWVADNIAAFGGDPTKVTVWGESAGAISIFDQMAMYDGDINYKGKPLFRGAIMESGSIIPADRVDSARPQAIYDQVVDAAGCSSAADTLDCLRSVDYATIVNATNSVPAFLSYTSVSLSYLPRPDGVILTDSPDVLALEGKYTPVPMIIGDQEDEGTLFALFQSNISTTDNLIDYLHDVFFQGSTRDQMATLVSVYPDDPSAGSPFNTGPLNNPYPQFKRLAAILGDLVFTLTRRLFLNNANNAYPDVPSWSYLASYDFGTPVLGTTHASDILQVINGIVPDYASAAFQGYYISFLYNLDPNTGRGLLPEWPQWSEKQQLAQVYSAFSTIIDDDFRNESYEWIVDNVDSVHI